MPPDSVPELLPIRLLAICRLWPQPCTKMPPPPCELLRMPRPSMLDGLHVKLLGKGLTPLAVSSPHEAEPLDSSVVPVGNPASNVASKGFWPWKFTPFDSTVIAAPSSAPISEGSCSSSARLPFRLASQPTVASSGRRSICGLVAVALYPNHPDPQPASQVFGEPSTPRP